jgi:AraC-like DNA-binding protein
MGFTYFLPAPALQDYIKNITIVDLYTSGNTAMEMTFVPDYHQYLCLVLADRVKVFENGCFVERSNAILVATHLGPTRVLFGKKHRAVYVQFKPIGLYSLLKIPQEEMVSTCCDANLFFGSQTDVLTEYLSEAATPALQNYIIQSFLIEKLSRLKTMLPFDRAIHAFIETGGNLSIEKTADFSCVSMRQFERLCKTRIGLSPKIFGRLIRFHNLYKLKELYPGLAWGEMALRCGYFDHMHMIRDFKLFTGINPRVTREEEYFRSFPYDPINPSEAKI